MRASPIRSFVLAAAFNLPLLAAPIAALGQVSFPDNPKTNAECDEPATKLQAMIDLERNASSQLIDDRNAIPFSRECAGDEVCRGTYFAEHERLHKLIGTHQKERDRLVDEKRRLETACRTAAGKNENIARQALRELKEGYEKAKRAYDQARAMVENIRNSPADAYAKRNEAHSAELESQMNTAKQYILDFQPKAEIVGAIQDASFFQLKSEVQQLNGDITALESAIQSIRSADAASSPPAPRPETTATGTGSGATDIADTLQRGVSQAMGWLSSVFSGDQKPSSGASADGPPADGTMASPAPAESPVEPVSYSPVTAPAPRALTASEQCAASDQTCRSACMGVAALGILSLFTRNNAAASEAGNQTQLCSNRCDEAKNSCDQQASAEQPGGPAVSAGSVRGLPVAECHRQANASDLGAKLNALPRDNNVLLLRGTIHNLDFLIRTYTQCLPDQETQQAINGWKTQREHSLRTCRQISSADNCLVSPFGTTASTAPANSTGGSSTGSGAPSGTSTHRNRCGGTIPLPSSYRCGGGGGSAVN